MGLATKTTYDQQVDVWVREAINNGANSLDDVVCALPGVYPTSVAASMKRIKPFGLRPTLAKHLDIQIVRASPRINHQTLSGADQLPVPHPLDYDWRFTTNTTNRITLLCRKLGRRLLCLGTPSVFVQAKSQNTFQSVSLIDKNREMTNCLRKKFGNGILQLDIAQDEIPRLFANVILLDPPWYLEHLREFIWAASHFCAQDGFVVVCLPSDGTRPNVNDELDQLLETAIRYGFSLYYKKSNALRYQTPQFEFNALRAAGIDIRSAWRTGSLWILRKDARNCEPRPRQKRICSTEWMEESIRGTRFCFRNKSGFGFGDPTLDTIVNGDVLPSVSRRHRLRDSVDVWTSGNRVFSCAGTMVLHRIAAAIADQTDPVRAVENHLRTRLNGEQVGTVTTVSSRLERLAILERHERTLSKYGSKG